MKRLLLGAIALLLICLAMPWAKVAPPRERRESVEWFASATEARWIPEKGRRKLDDWGVQPNRTPEEILFSIETENTKPFYRHIERNLEIHTWDYLRLPSAISTKFTILLTVMVPLAGLFALGQPKIGRYVPIIPAAALFFLLFQMPVLDTFGHTGDWQVLLFDTVSRSRVTFVPRLFVPVGLILSAIALSQLQSADSTDLPSLDDF